MENYKTQIFKDTETASRAVAELLKEKTLAKAATQEKFNVALSGGRTPKLLFTLLAEEYKDFIPWEALRFFWVDERCVEPADAESNFGMTYDALLKYGFVPAENIFRMRGEDLPENEAERYQKVLWDELPARGGFPVFDLLIMGLGEDGHTASIFPDNMALLDSEFSVGVGSHPVSGQKRITLTGQTINNAEQVLFLVAGGSKAEIIKQIIKKEAIAQKYPAAHIHGFSGNADFYLDKAAAELLGGMSPDENENGKDKN